MGTEIAKDNKCVRNNMLFTNKALWMLFLPLIGEQLLSFLVGLADSLMASFISEAAVSGVSLVDMLSELLISIFAALSTGGAVIIGQYLGARNQKGAQKTANQTIWFISGTGIVITLFIYLCKNIILHGLFGQIEPEVYSDANIYLLITAFSIPFLAMYNAGASIFRSIGNSSLPMCIMLCMNFVNIIGNALFIFVFHIGVAGLALSTLISRIGAAIIILYFCTKRKNTIFIEKFNGFDKTEIKHILNIGVPYSLENGVFYLGRLLLVSLVSTFGTASIAANSVGGTLTAFQALPGMAIGLGLSVVISRCAGANDFKQARYYTKKIIGIIFLLQIISVGLILAAMPFIMQIYDLSEEATRLIYRIIWSHGIIMILIWPFGNSLPIVFRAAGDAKFPMAICISTMIFCRIVMAYIFVYLFHMNMLAVWVAIYCDWAVKGAIFIWRYITGKWTKFNVVK